MSEFEYLTPAERIQLDADLYDLPDLADQLERHYGALLSRGERGDIDRAARYPTKFAVLDLADRRPKDGYQPDPQGEADLARRIGARRLGILPLLISWVGDIVGTMPPEQLHLEPSDPNRIMWVCHPAGDIVPLTGWEPTISREAHWLRIHLPWITGLPQAPELATDIHSIVTDLIGLVGPAHANPLPDREVLATEADLVTRMHVPRGTIRWWINTGRLLQACTADGRPQFDHLGRRVYFVVEAEALKVSARAATRRKREVSGKA